MRGALRGDSRATSTRSGFRYDRQPAARARLRLLHAHRLRDSSPPRSARRARVCGGGRYDGLVRVARRSADAGGRVRPGLERFLMVVEAIGGEAAARRGAGFQAIALGAPARDRARADRRRRCGACGDGRPSSTTQIARLRRTSRRADRNERALRADPRRRRARSAARSSCAISSARTQTVALTVGERPRPRVLRGTARCSSNRPPSWMASDDEREALERCWRDRCASSISTRSRVRVGELDIRARAPRAGKPPRRSPSPLPASRGDAAIGRARAAGGTGRRGERTSKVTAPSSASSTARRRRAPSRSSRSATASRSARRCASSRR